MPSERREPDHRCCERRTCSGPILRPDARARSIDHTALHRRSILSETPSDQWSLPKWRRFHSSIHIGDSRLYRSDHSARRRSRPEPTVAVMSRADHDATRSSRASANNRARPRPTATTNDGDQHGGGEGDSGAGECDRDPEPCPQSTQSTGTVRANRMICRPITIPNAPAAIGTEVHRLRGQTRALAQPSRRRGRIWAWSRYCRRPMAQLSAAPDDDRPTHGSPPLVRQLTTERQQTQRRRAGSARSPRCRSCRAPSARTWPAGRVQPGRQWTIERR